MLQFQRYHYISICSLYMQYHSVYLHLYLHPHTCIKSRAHKWQFFYRFSNLNINPLSSQIAHLSSHSHSEPNSRRRISSVSTYKGIVRFSRSKLPHHRQRAKAISRTNNYWIKIKNSRLIFS